MSTLAQFFGSAGSSGSNVPARILLVEGGSGAYATSFYNAVGSPYVINTCSGGMGGSVMELDFSISPGTYPVTVGAGATNNCCCIVCFFMPLQPMYQYICWGSAGGISNFGNLGTCQTPSCTVNYIPCSPTPTITVGRTPDVSPYTRSFLTTKSSSNNFSFSSCARYCWSLCGQSGIDISGVGLNGCASAAGTQMRGPSLCGFPGSFASYRILRGYPSSASTGPYSICVLNRDGVERSVVGAYVSDITGCVCAYGGSGTGIGPFCNNSCCTNGGTPVSVCNYYLLGYYNNPRSFVGSGQGASTVIGPASGAACPGSVTITYPTSFPAATVSSPCVLDCSPQTPGRRTYRFLCPGSFTI
jgi:hypothetical protein